MEESLTVHCTEGPDYKILLEKNFLNLKKAFADLGVSGRKGLIVTDETVAPLYLSEVRNAVEESFAFADALILPSGEIHKNTDTIGRILEQAVQDNFDRNDFLIALGGGVIGDMTGFAAAIYMRGIRFIQIPTTLLSQVDSSIGGKTGVDFEQYKNMVGAFHQPSLVYTNIAALKTLDPLQFASGMGEAIKHGLIRDKGYFEFMYAGRSRLADRDLSFLTETVYDSLIIKKMVVEEDPKEQGIRKILNFGHTLGHAIEKCSGFSYTHGQSVAFGTLAALHISGISSEMIRMTSLLMYSSGLETRLKPMDFDQILESVKKDKKMDQGRVSFILLHAIGDAYISRNVTEIQMRDALRFISE